MAALNHVCMWTNHGWEKITVEKATKLFPHTVEKKSGLFMCELCGQGVIFSRGKKKIAHFKHSRGEAEKNCPERTFSNANFDYRELVLKKAKLPLKIINSSAGIELYIGFPQFPTELLEDEFEIVIGAKG